jgi:xanthine/CO dehydrogenase XdhC/CoxF family maturation factor
MNETTSLVREAAALRERGEPFLVATVARVRGSSYRRPGARMLLTRDRWIAGSVSGGCLEGDVVKKGWWRTERGPALVTYDARGEDGVTWGFGLGCDGVVDVLLERAPREGVDALAFVGRCFRAQARGAIATVFAGEGAPVGARVALDARGVVEQDDLDEAVGARLREECRAVLASGATAVASFGAPRGPVQALVESVRPPPRLFVLGTGHDAVPVVAIARASGWEVLVCEPHARFATRERFAEADDVVAGDELAIAARIDASDRALAVVMAHDYARDRASLAMALATRALYIGVLGPRRRTARMLEELRIAAVDARVHAPVGLALGAETPQEIALAIVAEAQSVLTKTPATSLVASSGSIHAAAE